MHATVVSLGDGNEGSFGPTPEMAANFALFVDEVAQDTYPRRATRRIVCIDGREDETGSSEDDGRQADVQVPGSLPVTDTAGDMMNPALPTPRLSERAALNTRQAVAAGFEVVVHGDDHAGQAGCAANARMRDTLHKNYEAQEAVVPVVMGALTLMGRLAHVTEADVRQAIATGKERADDNTVWDVTPAQLIDIMVRNGARYQTLKGIHQERAVGLKIDRGTYASQTFARDHTRPDGTRDEVFMISGGEYAAISRELMRETNADSEREAALRTMRGLLYASGLAKKIGNQHLSIIAFSEGQP